MIDLISDTVTRPSQAMRAAMAAAPVGDDQYGEDPSVRALEEKSAALLGKERGLFFPSGTMTNQAALKVLTRPGDDVLIANEAHLVWHEGGAAAVNSGVQFTTIGERGVFDERDVKAACKKRGHAFIPGTTLVVIENTHNRFGGRIFPHNKAQSVLSAAKELKLATYLDGARLFNVFAATGLALSTLAEGFDLVGISLSKGLGCPVGSVLCGSKAAIEDAKLARRRFGGAMRQSGILAAAGIYALDHNMERLQLDHRHAALIGDALDGAPGIVFDRSTVETNIVTFDLNERAVDAQTLANAVAKKGVRIAVFGPRRVRMAAHLDVTEEQCRFAGQVMREALDSLNTH